MKKLILLIFIPLISFGQGEQLYADGTANDQDGNTFEWINYGEQDWSIENAEVVTYRDGTPIPQVTDNTEWANLNTGAWCYYDNDPSKSKLYNWYAVMGIHDTDPNTSNKEFAPLGWNIPSESDWAVFVNFLIENGYNFDGTSTENKIAKAVASTSGWNELSNNYGSPGNNQSMNNTSGFNAFPVGARWGLIPNNPATNGTWFYYGRGTVFWTSSEYNSDDKWIRYLDTYNFYDELKSTYDDIRGGNSVRFFRSASTASLNDFTNSISIFPNPSSDYISVNIDSEFEAVVFDLLGKELIREKITGRLDISCLEKGTYIINLTDGVNTSTHKIIKE